MGRLSGSGRGARSLRRAAQCVAAGAGVILMMPMNSSDQPLKILETERLILRRLLPADLANLSALYRDPEIRRYFPKGTLTYAQTQEELEWFLHGHPAHPELGLWATIHKA